jgi:hypothetical protein
MAEYLHSIISGVDAVCDGIGPSTSVSHVYAVHNQILTVIETGISCE